MGNTIYEVSNTDFIIKYLIIAVITIIPLFIIYLSARKIRESLQNIAVIAISILLFSCLCMFVTVPKTHDLLCMVKQKPEVLNGKIKDISHYEIGKDKSKETKNKLIRIGGQQFKIKDHQSIVEFYSDRFVEVEYLPHSKRILSIKIIDNGPDK